MVPHFSVLNPKLLSFPLRKGVLISLYGSLREATLLCTLFFLGKESANRFLFHLEELNSKQSPGHFARTIREGDVFILQLIVFDGF